MWCNSLLKQFSLQIRAAEKIQNILLELVRRKAAKGERYVDIQNLLTQVVKQREPLDLCLDNLVNDSDDLFLALAPGSQSK